MPGGVVGEGRRVRGHGVLRPGMLPVAPLRWLRPGMSAARVGERRAVVCVRLYFRPLAASLSKFGSGSARHGVGVPALPNFVPGFRPEVACSSPPALAAGSLEVTGDATYPAARWPVDGHGPALFGVRTPPRFRMHL